jgi:hypothetical protein
MNSLQVNRDGSTPESIVQGVAADSIPVKSYHTLFCPVWCTEESISEGLNSPFVQVTAIPPAALRPVGLRSGGTGFAGPVARTGPTRHSGEPIFNLIDSNT